MKVLGIKGQINFYKLKEKKQIKYNKTDKKKMKSKKTWKLESINQGKHWECKEKRNWEKVKETRTMIKKLRKEKIQRKEKHQKVNR